MLSTPDKGFRQGKDPDRGMSAAAAKTESLAAELDKAERLRVTARVEAMARAEEARTQKEQAMALAHFQPADRERAAAAAAAEEEEEAHQLQLAVASLRQSLAGSLTAVKDHFRTCDVDGDGLVSKNEFRSAIAALGLESTADVCDAAFDAYDFDRSGGVDYHAYVRHTLREALTHTASRVLDLFRRWDEDCVGTVDARAFRRGLVAMGFDAPRADFDVLYAELAKAGSSALLNYTTLTKTLRKGAI